MMVPLGVCSVLGVAFSMERYLRVRRSRVFPRRTEEILELIQQGRLSAAQDAAEAQRSPAGRILLAGLRRRGFGLREIESAMEDQGAKEAQRLQSPIRSISLIANISPLLGLLGTVIGIAQAFAQVVETGMGKPENLAEGIEVALITTIAGLVIAIPLMVVAAHLNARVRRLLLYADERIAGVVERLARAEGESHAA
jgi:biopolymer transport protein ExbB